MHTLCEQHLFDLFVHFFLFFYFKNQNRTANQQVSSTPAQLCLLQRLLRNCRALFRNRGQTLFGRWVVELCSETGGKLFLADGFQNFLLFLVTTFIIISRASAKATKTNAFTNLLRGCFVSFLDRL